MKSMSVTNAWKYSLREMVAICTILLMLALHIIHRKTVFDLPHLHSEIPVMPTTTVAMYASGNSTANVVTHSSAGWL